MILHSEWLDDFVYRELSLRAQSRGWPRRCAQGHLDVEELDHGTTGF